MKIFIKYLKTNTYGVIFLFILIFYCIILTQFGLENFDTGYIPSFSWRIINGQSVYQNFIYKGPPVTLYFHSVFMYVLPETGQFFCIRVVNYLLFATQVFLIVSAFDTIYDLSKYKIDKWGIICVGFIVSLLNFSPYPWPTTDGLLFAALAFWVVSKTNRFSFFRMLMISLCCVLSASTKQSFYLIPIFFLFWIFIKFNFKTALLFSFQLLFWIVVYLYLITRKTTLDNFIKQTTGETHLYDLFYTGLHNYIFIPISWFVILILTVSIFIYTKVNRKQVQHILPFIKWLSVVVFCIAILFCLFKKIEFASRIAFLGTAIGVVYAYGFQRKNLSTIAPILVALGIAWSCSISLGYQFPIFFSTGIISSFVISIGDDFKINSKYYFWIALPVCIMAFSYNYTPYREANIFKLKYSLESVSPKLKYIKTNKANFKKYTELKKLIGKYGENFIVAPNIPMANYLFNQQSELPADWLIETEVARSQKMFIRLASAKKNVVFLEKSFLNREECMPEKREKFSSISEFVYQHFNCIEETKYFLIYNALKKNETLP